MKDLLISHVADIDGVSPVILMKLCKLDFDYELKDINELEEYLSELLDTDLSIYNNIYITDLTVPESIYERINNSEYKNKFKVFDHHKTHMYACDYDYVTIDINECGTTLFYKYLKTKYKVKKSVDEYTDHVKNLDIWLWVSKDDIVAKQLGDLFDIFGIDRYINEMVKKLKYNRFKLSKLEKTILEIEQDKIDRYISKKEENMVILNYENYKAGLVFCEKYKSEMGNRLSVNHPELDFIIMINLSGGISFRTDKDIDLSEIAVKLNGGGHKKACGASIPNELKDEFIKGLFKGCEIIENQENNNR